MGRGWGGNIYGIYVFIINQFLCIIVPFGNASFFGISFSFGDIPTHHSYHFGVFNFLKCRSTFVFGHFSAADKSPFYYFLTHTCILFFKVEIKIKVIHEFRRSEVFQFTAILFGGASRSLSAVDKSADFAHFQ